MHGNMIHIYRLTHKNEINWDDETLPIETDFSFGKILVYIYIN